MNAITIAIGGISAMVAPQIDVWVADATVKVLRAEQPGPTRSLSLAGAPGEIVSGQIVVRCSDAGRLTASPGPLKAEGHSLPASCLRLQWVRYIDVKRNTEGVPADETIGRAPISIPDPFWEGDSVEAPAQQAQPLWVEARVPADARPGTYNGVVTVRAGAQSVQVPVALRVFGFTMPRERHQQTTNWFTFPGAGHSAAQDTDAWWDLARRLAALLAEHRQTCFNAHLSMIRTTYSPEKGYACDFGRLDRWAQTFFDAGLVRMELFQAGRATTSVDDRACTILPADLTVELPPGVAPPPAEHKLRGILGQLEKHLREKGWAGKVMIHVSDEPFVHSVPSYKAVARIVHEAAPSLKVIEAIEATGFGDAIDVLVPKLSHLNLWQDHFLRARDEGRELWFYTCCHPTGRYPNRFLDQPLVKARALHWLGYLYGLQGFLHWGLNWFADGCDPYSEEGISKDLPLGDRAVVYPGKDGYVGSLRLAAFRDGLQDYEYLWTLEQRLRSLKERIGSEADWLDPTRRPKELCRRVVQSFYEHTRDGATLLATRQTIAEEIEALARASSLYVQTEPMEGADVPAGPRHVIVRGIAEPGATITIEGKEVATAGTNGVFAAWWWLGTPEITVAASKDGRTSSVRRRFRLVD